MAKKVVEPEVIEPEDDGLVEVILEGTEGGQLEYHINGQPSALPTGVVVRITKDLAGVLAAYIK